MEMVAVECHRSRCLSPDPPSLVLSDVSIRPRHWWSHAQTRYDGMRTSVIFTSSPLPPPPRHRAVELGHARMEEGQFGRLWSRHVSAGALKDGMLTDGVQVLCLTADAFHRWKSASDHGPPAAPQTSASGLF